MQAKPARLLCKKGAVGGTRFDFVGEATLGRDPGCTVTCEADEVSSQHVRITWNADSGRYLLEDLGSLNGTQLDGESVSGPERLGRLHVITLGGAVEVIYQGPEIVGDAAVPAVPPADPPAARDRTIVASEPLVLPGALASPPEGASEAKTLDGEWPADLPSVFTAAPKLGERSEPEQAAEPEDWLLEVSGYGPPDGFRLQPGANRVGRLPEGEVIIDGPGISRLHAVLTVDGDRLTVRDEGSRNRTWLDGEPIAGEVELAPGAALRFGRVAATLRRVPQDRRATDGRNTADDPNPAREGENE